tara:strand:+ start:1621 stop:2661 length:1041 start_codon:yes stop_codon:yes gene_type:complete
MSNELKILDILPCEIVHHWESKTETYIYSKANIFWGKINGNSFSIRVDISLKTYLSKKNRLLRRALRSDKSNAFFNFNRDGIVIIYFGKIYYYCLNSYMLRQVGATMNCRVALHSSIAVTSLGIFFGEYGSNNSRKEVPVFASYDDGRTWEIVYKFQKNTIKHIHGIFYDKFSNSLFIATGDFENECFLAQVKNLDFSHVELIGDGSQKFRSCYLFFTNESIIWGMDSQLETSYLQVYNRKTRKLEQGRSFPGPIWYAKSFTDGSAICQSTVEIGQGVKSQYANLFYSKDLINWNSIAKFKKDCLPMRYFKFGVIAFSEGVQTPSNFTMHAEGLVRIDGKSMICSV